MLDNSVNGREKNRKIVVDVVKVSLGNLVNLFSGVLVGFLLPKLIGITDYGYYKTFTLYATYVGLFHFGMSDGIYLKFGGKDYQGLKKERFRFYSFVFFSMELLLSCILTSISIIILSGDYKFIFICIAIYLFVHNITSYFQMISQITSRFNELSLRNIIQSVLTIGAIIILWVLHDKHGIEISYKTYITIFIGISIILTALYMHTYREIIFGKMDKHWSEIPELVFMGFPLMISNLCASLILTLDRQFVNILFDKDIYAIYAFAYNMLSLITTATSAISAVLYPNLKRIDRQKLEHTYTKLISMVIGLVFLCLLVYFPLGIFVEWFLPQYVDSLAIFRIIFPGLAISSAITIVMHNYYKILGVTFKYFVKSVVVLFVSVALNYLAFIMFNTTISISISSIISMVIWYVYVEFYFVKEYKVKWVKNLMYIIFMTIAFYSATKIENYYCGLALYFVLYISITAMMFLKELKAYCFK